MPKKVVEGWTKHFNTVLHTEVRCVCGKFICADALEPDASAVPRFVTRIVNVGWTLKDGKPHCPQCRHDWGDGPFSPGTFKLRKEP